MTLPLSYEANKRQEIKAQASDGFDENSKEVRIMRFTKFSTLCVGLVVMALLVPSVMLAQSTTNGAVSGTVTDATGAVIPNLKVVIKSTEKGFTQEAKTNTQGFYQFSLLEPGTYSLTIAAPSFKTLTETITVSVGANAIINPKLEVGAAGTTVEVSAESALLQTESAEVSTTFNAREISEVPNPGNDLSFVAQTAAGSVMNTGSGYGNFSSFGVSASSNLFTLNGMYDNDPFLNLNNSGATNLLLGNNEVQEATVVTNGYSGQYGGFAGANVNYITKSGSNNWHGNANYWWDGRAMNANNFFNHPDNQDGYVATPRPFVNANQYAASFGGPIWKNKIFAFWNYEGLRVILPTSTPVEVPDPAFQTAILDNLNATGLGQSTAFYTQAFGLYNTTPGLAARGVKGVPSAQDTTGCEGGFYTDATTGNSFGVNPATKVAGLPCTDSFRSSLPNFTHEYLTSGRFDFNLTNNDKVFVRLQEDKGVQATYTDPINSIFNAVSTQPEYQGQVSWNRAFGVKSANNLVFSDQWYSAIFTTANLAASLAAFPTSAYFIDGSVTNLGGIDFAWPQGRNVTGYQIVDDYSYNLNSQHTLKLGLNFHRNLVSDHDYGSYTSGFPLETLGWLYAGAALMNVQSFPASLDQDIKLYQLGWYLQDEWKVKSNLKLTLAVRADHNKIPSCQADCFARLAGTFDSINHNVNTPYNQSIQTGIAQALPSFTTIAWQPRFGLSYSPTWLKNTVFRGGIGLFMDTFPGQIADNLSENLPLENEFGGYFGNYAPQQVAAGTGTPVVGLPGFSGNIFSVASASNTALLAGYKSGGTLASISSAVAAAGASFAPPNFTSVAGIKAPEYWEWNFEVQHAIGNSTSVTINYVGNHGYHETGFFNNQNAYCPVSVCPNGFVNLPNTQPDQRFNAVTQVETAAVSNYNGLSFTAQHRFGHGLQMQANYTWSHALDEISNGGFNPFIGSFGGGAYTGSLLYPINDSNLHQYNYGNADYDTRHYVSMNYVYELPKGPTAFLKGWQLSGTLFARSGLPYTVVNSNASSTLDSFGYGAGTQVYANYAGPSHTPSCHSPSTSSFGPCFSTALFPNFAGGAASQLLSDTENQTRNQFYGPHYFDTDFTLMKYTAIPHWEGAKVGIGAQFFNLFNHPNFQPPVNDVNNGQLGQVLYTVNTPTSILGSFLGGDASPRLIQLTMKFNF
jgi:Carboxypeptidase regulatory-like domain